MDYSEPPAIPSLIEIPEEQETLEQQEITLEDMSRSGSGVPIIQPDSRETDVWLHVELCSLHYFVYD